MNSIVWQKCKKSGLLYRLWLGKQSGLWYLSANDGIVPSGQMVYGFCFRKLLESINCEVA
jgi:hypothetical protein